MTYVSSARWHDTGALPRRTAAQLNSFDSIDARYSRATCNIVRIGKITLYFGRNNERELAIPDFIRVLAACQQRVAQHETLGPINKADYAFFTAKLAWLSRRRSSVYIRVGELMRLRQIAKCGKTI